MAMTGGSMTTGGAARPADDALAATLPFIVAAAVYIVILTVGSSLLNDADSYWHVVAGGWILANGIPTTDPFSHTFAGAPWIAKEWLSQILYYGAYQLAGWTGMVVLAAGAVALSFFIVSVFLQRWLAPIAIMAVAAIGFLLVAPHAVARPHVLALPIMAAWMAGLVSAADEKRPPSLWLLPLMVLWANLHGGFTFGLLMVGALGLDAVVAAEKPARARLAARWALFGIAALAAACITPYGPESILVTGRILGLGPALALIGEWQPADFSTFQGLEVALLFGLGLALWRGFTLPPVRIVILLGLLHMALSASRNAELLALIAPLIIAAPLARQYPYIAARPLRHSRTLIATGVVLLIPATLGLSLISDYQPTPLRAPTAAVAALKQANAGPVLNDYDFGGYLVWNGIPSFVDGRTELYGGDFVARYHRAVTLADIGTLESLLEEHAIGATLLMNGTPAIAWLDRQPGWQRLHADNIAVVHVRRNAAATTAPETP